MPPPAGSAAGSSFDLTFGGARRDRYGQDIFGLSATTEIDREEYGRGWLVGKKVTIEIAGEAIRQTD
ncbi:hypothetical protein KIN34_07410 [Cellulomonas sp. DKR-3]|uniref:Lipid/polyisoprenoid-binding YceI-like domain-containing protein n=1 Tax=Cellulomonas fulva TaxID=2835530 RepID=A0ABS5TY77_9CELL|nr:YceI family protein [Cellulomonas fulva]MBT0994110.1 hypothetical protein [Cellulomonas fulva]